MEKVNPDLQNEELDEGKKEMSGEEEIKAEGETEDTESNLSQDEEKEPGQTESGKELQGEVNDEALEGDPAEAQADEAEEAEPEVMSEEFDFDVEINNIMVKLNNLKISKATDFRTSSFYNSLKLLTELDIDKCDFLINEYIGSDECKKFNVLEDMTF